MATGGTQMKEDRRTGGSARRRACGWPLWFLVVGGLACSGDDDAGKPTGGGGAATSGGAGAGGAAGTASSTSTAGSAGTTSSAGTAGAGAGGAGTAGAAGTAGSAGNAGRGGSGGSGGTNGDSGTADAARETGTDGSAKDAGTPDGTVADAKGDAGASCVGSVHDWYVLRTDGKLLIELADQASSQIPVLDAATGLPLTNVVQAAGGAAHGCAVLSTGAVSCWREAPNSNAHGQLGNGMTDTNSGPLYRATPVLLGAGQALMNVAELTHGSDANLASCAVTRGGQLWCWGDLTWIINNGTPMNSVYAVPISSNGSTPLDRIAQASMSPYFACAVVMKDTTREVWCWGSNGHANVGQADKMPRQYPTRVAGLTDPSLVRVIGYNDGTNIGGTACAIDVGQVRCWGSNATGCRRRGQRHPSHSRADARRAPEHDDPARRKRLGERARRRRDFLRPHECERALVLGKRIHELRRELWRCERRRPGQLLSAEQPGRASSLSDERRRLSRGRDHDRAELRRALTTFRRGSTLACRGACKRTDEPWPFARRRWSSRAFSRWSVASTARLFPTSNPR